MVKNFTFILISTCYLNSFDYLLKMFINYDNTNKIILRWKPLAILILFYYKIANKIKLFNSYIFEMYQQF